MTSKMIRCHHERTFRSLPKLNHLPKPQITAIFLALSALLFACAQRNLVFADEINSNYHVSSNTNTETVKIGNSKTKNYNIHESNYLPTQLTQVVLNVPKAKKLRKLRAPTEEEFSIKRRIIDVYEQLQRESGELLELCERFLPLKQLAALPERLTLHLNHLGRILQALNPKYIATERVRNVAFADPADGAAVVAGADANPPTLERLTGSALSGGQSEGRALSASAKAAKLTLQLTGLGDAQLANSGARKAAVAHQLDSLNERFKELIKWDQQFIELLASSADAQLNPTQLAYKRLLLCLSQPLLCAQADDERAVDIQRYEDEAARFEQVAADNSFAPEHLSQLYAQQHTDPAQETDEHEPAPLAAEAQFAASQPEQGFENQQYAAEAEELQPDEEDDDEEEHEHEPSAQEAVQQVEFEARTDYERLQLASPQVNRVQSAPPPKQHARHSQPEQFSEFVRAPAGGQQVQQPAGRFNGAPYVVRQPYAARPAYEQRQQQPTRPAREPKRTLLAKLEQRRSQPAAQTGQPAARNSNPTRLTEFRQRFLQPPPHQYQTPTYLRQNRQQEHPLQAKQQQQYLQRPPAYRAARYNPAQYEQ